MGFKLKSILTPAVIVASLGYFVDIYDLVLFSIVRVPSLKSLGLTEAEIFSRGIWLLDSQMLGMLVGGLFWGILSDKKGRLSVLFGSIFLYSAANFANAFVHSVPAYAILRFIAGIGLAGELGAGITLVSETLSKENRGYGTMIVASVGVSGAILAALLSEHFDWRTTYIIGGVLGFALLFLRIGVMESGIFKQSATNENVKKGSFFSLFTSKDRFFRYLRCILIGSPTWYVIGILMTFAPEFAKALSISGAVTGGQAILHSYLGLVFGDFASGFLSQKWKSRKKVLLLFLSLTALMTLVYFSVREITASQFYLVCTCMGFAVGFWAIFATVAAEQFGTNLRGTVAITVPNFVRGMLIPITSVFVWLKGSQGILFSGIAVGVVLIVISFLASFGMRETFGTDLDYLE